MSWVMYSFKLDKQSECFAINKTHCMLDFYRLLFFLNKINFFGKHLQDYPSREVGGTLISSYIRRLGSFFGVQNFEFQ